MQWKTEYAPRYQRWFAWHPVRLEEDRRSTNVWWEWVYREWHSAIDSGFYTYTINVPAASPPVKKEEGR